MLIYYCTLLLASMALAGLGGVPSCASDQATSWEAVSGDGDGSDGDGGGDGKGKELKDPSWPFVCTMLYKWERGDTLAGVLELVAREAYEVFVWNCFLGWEAEVDFDIGAGAAPRQICVEAEVPEEEDRRSDVSGFVPPGITEVPTLSPTSSSSASASSWALSSSGVKGGSVIVTTITLSDEVLLGRRDGSSNDGEFEYVMTAAAATQSTSPSWGKAWTPFDKPCDAAGRGATNCAAAAAAAAATVPCDPDLRELPVCEDGKCVCKTIPCRHEAGACDAYADACRRGEQEIACVAGGQAFPDLEGVCACRARETGCLREDGGGGGEDGEDGEGWGDRFCSGVLDCGEEGFAPYVEYGQCVGGLGGEDAGGGGSRGRGRDRGRCVCKVVECPYRDGRGDDSVCEKKLACGEEGEGGGEEGVVAAVPECHLKYLDAGADPDRRGYCICNDAVLVAVPGGGGGRDVV